MHSVRLKYYIRLRVKWNDIVARTSIKGLSDHRLALVLY
jgi:hypothetical protein